MRRAVLAVVGTVAGLIVLLGYKSTPPPIRKVIAGPATTVPRTSVPPRPPAVPSTAAPPPPPPPSTTAVTTATVPVTNPRSSRQQPATVATPPAAAPPPAPPATTPVTKQYTGSVASTQYGNVQVQITVSGGRMTDVQALQLPSDYARSQQISDYAGPKLRQEALDAQSANIDTVSGATYTSDGYRQSLQSALDQVHP